MKALLILLLAILPARACLWDTDTIREELSDDLEPVKTIVGWFNRYPPLYYEMRLERVSQALAEDPTQASLYDDAAVACDRLGKPSEAIAWMEKKKLRAAPELSKEGEPSTRYKTLANLGTFHAHRWIKARKAGQDPQQSDLSQAISYVEQAIRENANAHFGREKYQLLILQWLQGEENIFSNLEDRRSIRSHETGIAGEKLSEGLLGLIRLGAAWESPDIYYFLQGNYDALRLEHPRLLSNLRVAELLADGKTFLSPDIEPHFMDPADAQDGSRLQHRDALFQTIAYYETARQAAEAREAALTNYLTERLQQGRHPDTEPDFFQEWQEPAFPELPVQAFSIWREIQEMNPLSPVFIFSGIVSILLLFAAVRVIKALKRRA